MSKTTWLAWILVWNLMCKYTEVSADTEGPKCDPPWEKLHRTCVQFMKAKPFLTWQKARDSCISMNADLLSVNDKEENGKLKPLVRRHVRSRDLLYWWIGIREVGHSWLWLDNDEQYANIPEWAAGPGRFHTGRCGLYSFRGTLENVECELEKPYICEQFKVTTDSRTSKTATTRTTEKATSVSTDKKTPNPITESYTTTVISKGPLTDRITPSTGSPTVSPLHQRSDLICQPNSLVISLPDTLFPEQRNITWKEDTCRVTYNGSHYVSDISLTDCGTTVLIENDTVIFSNELIVHRVADDNDAAKEREASSITFGENYETVIPVKCIYPRLNNVSTNYIPVKQNVRFIEKRYGTLDVAMQQFENERFEKSFSTDSFPRKVPLNDDVFIRVGLNFEPNSVRVITDKCIATSSPSCADSNWQPLIISGCPKDSVSLLSTNVSSDVRFSFKAFDFRNNSSGFVYIHCEVSVCGTDDISCIMGCASRAKRSASSRQGSHLVSTGPLLIERQDDKEVVTMPTVLVVVCAVVAMASLIVAVVGWTRKHRTISAAI